MASCCSASPSPGVAVSLAHARAVDQGRRACPCSPFSGVSAASHPPPSSLPFPLTPSLASTRCCSDAENSLEAAALAAAAGACGACGHAQPRAIQPLPPGTSIESLYKFGPILSVCQVQQAKEQRAAAAQAGAKEAAGGADRARGAPGEETSQVRSEGGRGDGRRGGGEGGRDCGGGTGKPANAAAAAPPPVSTRPVLRHAVSRGTHQAKIIKSIDKQRIPASAGGDRLWRRLCMRLLNLPPHRNVLSLDAVYEEKHKFYFVSEKLEGGELFDFLLTEKTVEEHICQYIIFQILQALHHMHSNQLLHRDIKPENLMFRRRRRGAAPPCDASGDKELSDLSSAPPNSHGGDARSECDNSTMGAAAPSFCSASSDASSGFFSCPSDSTCAYQGAPGGPPHAALTPVEREHELVLIDFDTCKMMEVLPQEYGEVTGGQRRLVGTYGYLAPEVLRGGEYTVQSDLWSVGVILYILMTGIPPLPMELLTSARASLMVFSQIQEKQGGIDYGVFPLPDFPLARDLCQKLLQINPRQRIASAREALAHPWLRDFTLRFGEGGPTPVPAPHCCGCGSAVLGEAMSLPCGRLPPSLTSTRLQCARAHQAGLDGRNCQAGDRHCCVQSNPFPIIGLPGSWRDAPEKGRASARGSAASCRCEAAEEGQWDRECGRRPETSAQTVLGAADSGMHPAQDCPSDAPRPCVSVSHLRPQDLFGDSAPGVGAASHRLSASALPLPSLPCFPAQERVGAMPLPSPCCAPSTVATIPCCAPPVLSPARVRDPDAVTPTLDGVMTTGHDDTASADGLVGDFGVADQLSRQGRARRHAQPRPESPLVWLGSPGAQSKPAGGSHEAVVQGVASTGQGGRVQEADVPSVGTSGTGSLSWRLGEDRFSAAFSKMRSALSLGFASASPSAGDHTAPVESGVLGERTVEQPPGCSFNLCVSLSDITDASARLLRDMSRGGELGGELLKKATASGSGPDRSAAALFEPSLHAGMSSGSAAEFGFANPECTMAGITRPEATLAEAQMMEVVGSCSSSHRGAGTTSGTRSRSLSAERGKLKEGRVGVPGGETATDFLVESDMASHGDAGDSVDESRREDRAGGSRVPAGSLGEFARGPKPGAVQDASCVEMRDRSEAGPSCASPNGDWMSSCRHETLSPSYAKRCLEESHETCEVSSTSSTTCTPSNRGPVHLRHLCKPRHSPGGRFAGGNEAVGGYSHPANLSGFQPDGAKGSRRTGSPCTSFSSNSFEESPCSRRKRVASPDYSRGSSASSATPPGEDAQTAHAASYTVGTTSTPGRATCDAVCSDVLSDMREFSAPDIAEEHVAQTPLIPSPSNYPPTRPFFFGSPQTTGMACSSPASTTTTASSLSHIAIPSVATPGAPASGASCALPLQPKATTSSLSLAQSWLGGEAWRRVTQQELAL
ncbi:protein kinase [Besnoitia besnoiti]|uniref:Protein kinase n=1 Tax=Besnoitia besnoiti TaxID=94643 RepID=A0A2A9M3G2_BESBE|nr:protein kinase [Besnoitia besnoiti]PFH33028.1 protein kinase [Besnoitia besnoiti]